jgi:hypothetical protein
MAQWRRSWMMVGHDVYCYRSRESLQLLAKFREPARLTQFHDESLAQVTRDINALLSKTQRANKDSKRELAIISTPRGPMLAWTRHGVVSPDDEDAKIEKALGFK